MKLIRNALAFLSLLLLLAHTTPITIDKEKCIDILFQAKTTPPSPLNMCTVNSIDEYGKWKLQPSGLTRLAFELGIKGFHFFEQRNKLRKTNLLTIIDYSLPSSKKRLFVLDMRKQKIVFNTFVAHGRNSGDQYATEFSNEEESHKSSLGFYITLDTYTGVNGYSLQLKGCEKGINDNAVKRLIVFHGANYASEKYLYQNGTLGRSYGCPAVPLTANKKIIDKIKNGTCMFLFHPSKTYLNRSKILDS